jgi:cell division protein FtsW (lipid II flippase)
MDSLGVTDRHGRYRWSSDCKHPAPSGLRRLVPPLDYGGRWRWLALILERLPLQRLKPFLIPVFGLTVASLIAVRLIGTTALGAQRWISIGGIHVQPSEFAKIAAILLLAAVLSRHPVERPVDVLRPLGVISIPWLLVFIQPDLGTSLVFGALMLAMLYWSGMPIEWVVLLLSPLVTALLAGISPWAMGLWIPLMALLAYRSLPWETRRCHDHDRDPWSHGHRDAMALDARIKGLSTRQARAVP